MESPFAINSMSQELRRSCETEAIGRKGSAHLFVLAPTHYIGYNSPVKEAQKLLAPYNLFSWVKTRIFGSSSMVEQEAVNFEVAGSSPASRAMIESPAEK